VPADARDAGAASGGAGLAAAGDGNVITETARLRIRRLADSDAAFVVELVNDPDFIANIADKGIHTLDDAVDFIRDGAWTNQPQPGHGQFAVDLKATGETAGICGLLYREVYGASDVGFAFLPRFRRRGLALEAARALMAYGHAVLGMHRILGITADANRASQGLLVKLGMRPCEPARFRYPEPGTVVYEWTG
jgi:RimJ/RimL family protein N-acetyltransferase